jgi:hypothetical protein
MRSLRASYQKLAQAGSESVVRLDLLERFEEGELGGAGERVKRREMREGDVYVRVPVAAARVGAEQVFPEVLEMILRREEGRFKIAGVNLEGSP